MLGPQSLFLTDAIIERIRTLSVPGRVLVRNGQQVKATDPVAEELIYQEHILLDVVRGLGVPEEKVDGLLQCHAGMKVDTGDLLAGPIGFPRRVIRAPKPGKVIYTGLGLILIGVEGKYRHLLSGYSGQVIELLPDRGVKLQTFGSLVQGVWGNQKIGQGEIAFLMTSPDATISSANIQQSMRGKIIVGGYCSDELVFSKAEQYGLQGIILSSLATSLHSKVLTVPFPVLLIEGFGLKTMNNLAYEIFQACDKRLASINAETGNENYITRPEVVLLSDASEDFDTPFHNQLFEPGKLVRIFNMVGQNQLGVILDFLGRVKFAGGFAAEAVRVRLHDGSIINVPLLNIELIGGIEGINDD